MQMNNEFGICVHYMAKSYNRSSIYEVFGKTFVKMLFTNFTKVNIQFCINNSHEWKTSLVDIEVQITFAPLSFKFQMHPPISSIFPFLLLSFFL